MELDLSKFFDKINAECLNRDSEFFCKCDIENLDNRYFCYYETWKIYSWCDACKNTQNKLRPIMDMMDHINNLHSQIDELKVSLNSIADAILE